MANRNYGIDLAAAFLALVSLSFLGSAIGLEGGVRIGAVIFGLALGWLAFGLYARKEWARHRTRLLSFFVLLAGAPKLLAALYFLPLNSPLAMYTTYPLIAGLLGYFPLFVYLGKPRVKVLFE
ncbi:MAG: hypothetical protein CMN28_13740 [Salinisphaeraceae bacterium]|nr:hypothetical protein [Salinisphaeraceae bacterium]